MAEAAEEKESGEEVLGIVATAERPAEVVAVVAAKEERDESCGEMDCYCCASATETVLGAGVANRTDRQS